MGELKALCEGKSPQCISIEDAEAKAKCEAAAVDGGKEEETQCSHIENPELKALCEGKSPQCISIEDAEAKAKCEAAAVDGGKEEETQCSHIEDPEAKAKCEAALDGEKSA